MLCVLLYEMKQIQKKWDQNDKADPEKQPALEENDLKPAEGETIQMKPNEASRLGSVELTAFVVPQAAVVSAHRRCSVGVCVPACQSAPCH